MRTAFECQSVGYESRIRMSIIFRYESDRMSVILGYEFHSDVSHIWI